MSSEEAGQLAADGGIEWRDVEGRRPRSTRTAAA